MLPLDLPPAARLGDFLLGYLVVLATPGPNLLVIGGVASLRGLRGALPLCLGVALGASALSAAVAATIGAAVGNTSWNGACRLVGACLLLWVAFSIARSRPPDPAGLQQRAARGVEFGAAFCTAATNPLTGAFFAAQFLGPISTSQGMHLLVPLAVASMALGFFLLVASLFARPSFRGAALVWHQPIRFAAAIALMLMAASIVMPVLDWSSTSAGAGPPTAPASVP
jgi:threonine/homoserine/homoserine lactone efflux protein